MRQSIPLFPLPEQYESVNGNGGLNLKANCFFILTSLMIVCE